MEEITCLNTKDYKICSAVGSSEVSLTTNPFNSTTLLPLQPHSRMKFVLLALMIVVGKSVGEAPPTEEEGTIDYDEPIDGVYWRYGQPREGRLAYCNIDDSGPSQTDAKFVIVVDEKLLGDQGSTSNDSDYPIL